MRIECEPRFSAAIYKLALDFVKESPHAVTRKQLIEHIGRSVTLANRIVHKMKSEGLIIAEAVVDQRRVAIVTYRAAGAELVPPPGTTIPQTTQRAMKRLQDAASKEMQPHCVPPRDPLHAFLFGPAQRAA